MAYHYEVTSANGTCTEEVRQILTNEGQSLQFQIIGDVNSSSNIISPIVAYTPIENSEQILFSQSQIGNQVSNEQLDTRQCQNVYLIKTNDASQLIYQASPSTKPTNNKIKGQGDIKICYAPQRNQWGNPSSTGETYELIFDKDPTSIKNFNVKNSQVQTHTTQIPNIQVQRTFGKSQAIQIRQGISLDTSGVRNINKNQKIHKTQAGTQVNMRRSSVNNSKPAARRISGASQTLMITAPKPSPRPPIHPNLSIRHPASAASKAQLHQVDLNNCSEKVKEDVKRRQTSFQSVNERKLNKSFPQPNHQLQTTQTNNAKQRTGQVASNQFSLQQQQQQQKTLHSGIVLSANPQRRSVSTSVVMASQEEQPMEVDENEYNLEKVSQQYSVKSEPESNSESYAYLQQEIKNPESTIVQHQIVGNEAKMLVILKNNEQRLITFEVPKENCTVQDLLEQANISTGPTTSVSLVSDPTLGINYIVDESGNNGINEYKEASINNKEALESTENVGVLQNKSGQIIQPVATVPSISPSKPIYKEGLLAVCSFCGMSAQDFNHCMRCKRKLPDNVKAMPVSIKAQNELSKKENTIVTDPKFYNKNASLRAEVTVMKRGRGRASTSGITRGGLSRTNPRQSKEPECLTISSDEEDDIRKRKATESKMQKGDASKSILEKELTNTKPTQFNVSMQRAQINKNNLGGNKDQVSQISSQVSIECRSIRIGSYKYSPKENISVSSQGIKLLVPLLEDDKSCIQLNILDTDIIEMSGHFSKNMIVIFIKTSIKFGKNARELLGMQDPKSPYFDPYSEDPHHQKITLLLEYIDDDSKKIFQQNNKFKEISLQEANNILLATSPKTQPGMQTRRSIQASSSSNVNTIIQTITVYPAPPAKGGIAINTEDFSCLGEDVFLNDVIIDFYLKYLTLEVLSATDSNRTHVFSSYFYKRLTSPHSQAVEGGKDLSPAAKRHARVQKWTKNVNIFQKDFVIIPINVDSHWFLAIICFPGLVTKPEKNTEDQSHKEKIDSKVKKEQKKLQAVTIGNTTITPVSTITIDTNDDQSERDEAESEDDELDTDSEEDEKKEAGSSNQNSDQLSLNKEVTKVPCILIFDSLAGHSRNRVISTLRDYLYCEHLAKMGSEKLFSKETIRGSCPKVPQQSNFTDCGLYVLQYVESFFKNPIQDYTLPIKSLKNWFEEIIVTRKREDLAILLVKLVNDSKGEKVINLPTLVFPTKDGKLKPRLETKAVKEESEKNKNTNENETKNVLITVTTENKDSQQQPVSQASNSSSEVSTSKPSGGLLSRVTGFTESVVQNLRKQRISRPPKTDNQEEKQDENQVAKKHKGESYESCK